LLCAASSNNKCVRIMDVHRSVENDSLCNLVYVQKNMHMLPCSILPIVGNKSSYHVQHEKPKSWEDMLSFGEHLDTAHEI
jgi:hypothetical protein